MIEKKAKIIATLGPSVSSSSKLKKSGLKLGNNLDKEIKETLQLLKNI